MRPAQSALFNKVQILAKGLDIQLAVDPQLFIPIQLNCQQAHTGTKIVWQHGFEDWLAFSMAWELIIGFDSH
jgi:hypothetical protein